MLQTTVDPTWNLCTRYPLMLFDQKQCRMRNLLKVFTRDQWGNQTSDLSLSGPTPLPVGHELLPLTSPWPHLPHKEASVLGDSGFLGATDGHLGDDCVGGGEGEAGRDCDAPAPPPHTAPCPLHPTVLLVHYVSWNSKFLFND
jgi:hypothetical protein